MQTYLVFCQHLLCEAVPVPQTQDNSYILRFILDTFGQQEHAISGFTVPQLDFMSPQVDYIVLMVSSVEVDIARVDEHERKQDDEDLNGVFASVYKISVKQIGFL